MLLHNIVHNGKVGDNSACNIKNKPVLNDVVVVELSEDD